MKVISDSTNGDSFDRQRQSASGCYQLLSRPIGCVEEAFQIEVSTRHYIILYDFLYLQYRHCTSSTIIRDRNKALPHRSEILNAVGEALELLQKLVTVENPEKMTHRLLSKLAQQLPL